MRKIILSLIFIFLLAIGCMAQTWGGGAWGTTSYNTNWEIKHFIQKSGFNFYRPLDNDIVYVVNHKLIWSNHISNPPKLAYVLEPIYETNLLDRSALGINGRVEYTPNKKFNCNIGVGIKNNNSPVLNGGIGYKW